MTIHDQSVAWKLSGFGDEIDADPAVQVAVLQALGASHIEVRSAWHTNIIDMTTDQVSELAQLFKANAMRVSAVASPVGKVDVGLAVEHEVKRLGRAITAANILGTRYIRIFSFYYPGRSAVEVRNDVITRMKALARVAEDAGVILLHENEKLIFGDVPSRVLDIMQSVNSPALRVAWDPANFVQVGVKPFDDAYVDLRPYFEYLQIKDALFVDGRVTVSGEGDGQVRATVRALRSSGYSGFVSLEPHLTTASRLGGYSGTSAFGRAARSFRRIADSEGVELV